jgi:hypothetical protein
MKNFKFTTVFSFAAILSLLSCNTNQPKNTVTEKVTDTASFILRGDSISSGVQKILLANVMLAMKSGGPVNAVSFCSERAMPLTDSLAKAFNCEIKRVSDKFRNPANKPTDTDLDMWTKISSSKSISPVVSAENGHIVYYKPILIAMPACLKCHGSPGKEIDSKTLEIIRKNYPEDQATGYKEGDLRGMWKISFL